MNLTILYSVILIELLIVGWLDFKYKKISNYWIGVNLGLSIICHMTFQSLFPLSWELLLFPVGFLVIGFFLYLLHIMGAGDSKFLASLFLVIPAEYHLMYFSKLVLATICVGFILLVMHLVKNTSKLKAYFIGHHWAGIKEIIKSKFSYAPVMLLAWLLFGADLWN